MASTNERDEPVRLPVILDVDTGIDDSLALLYGCASPELEIVAVTCVAGNVGLAQVIRNTRAVLALAGRADIAVSPGADRPLVKPLETTEETHGPRGVGYAELPLELPAISAASDTIDAADRIIDVARRRPGEVHLVTLGPMTNLAVALDREPRLPRLLRGWTFMGGAFLVPGNTTPTSEWNVYVDPDAAKACLEAWSVALTTDPGVRLPVGIGLDVTEESRLLPGAVAQLALRGGAATADADLLARGAASAPMLAVGSVAANPLLRFIVDALRFYFEFHATHDGFYGAFIHDPFVVAATADPTLITTRPLFVDIEAGPGLAHATSVADWLGITGRSPNVAVAVSGDATTFLDRLVERLGALGAR